MSSGRSLLAVVKTCQSPFVKAGQPLGGADPDGAIGTHGEAVNPVVWQLAVGGIEDLPGALVKAGQSPVGADPQGAVGTRGKL